MPYVGVIPIPGFAIKSSALVLRGLSPGTGGGGTSVHFCQALTCPEEPPFTDAGPCIRVALLAPVPRQQALQVGVAAPFAMLYAYAHGGTVGQDTFVDAGLVTPNTNPLVADMNGEFGPFYLLPGANYDMVLRSSTGALIWSQPNIMAGAACDVVVTDDILQAEAFL